MALFYSAHDPVKMILNCSSTSRDLWHESLHHRQSFTSSRSLSLNLYTQRSKCGPGSSRGFKQPCRSKTLPAKFSLPYDKKKKSGGVLPSILESLESDDSVEKTLGSVFENLSTKEQTAILKEQQSWCRMLQVFEFFNSQEEYVPNVIHYNLLVRALGRAQKWDELRLRLIEMAKRGILPTDHTYGILVDVYGKAGLVKESLLWIKHMRLLGMFPGEVTMNTVVRVLKDAGEYDRADRFYKHWCLGRVELDDLELDLEVGDDSDSAPISFKQFLLTWLFRMGSRTPVSKSSDPADAERSTRRPWLTSTYNNLIDLYGKAGRLKDAAVVFSEMLNSGVAMDTITFNTMIFTCGSHGHLLEAESLLGKMEEEGILPNTRTYNIFISLYASSGNIEAALRYYRNIRKVGLSPNAVSHRAMLHVLCERNMVQEAEAVVEEMENFGLAIDEHSLPVLMKMYIGKGLLDKANVLFEKVHSKGEILSKTRAAVMDAYAENGLWVETEAVFYSKRDVVGSKNGVLEYNVMIKAYGKAKLYDKAFALFKSMRNHGTWPDECTYNSLIQMFAGVDMVGRSRDLLREMQVAGLKPHCSTFSSLIACYVRLGQLHNAVDIFEAMGAAGVKPNEVVYGSLINGYAEAGELGEALRCFHMMEECGLPANKIVLTTMIKAYSKVGSLESAKKLYDEMKKLEGGPDVIASNSILHIYADHGIVSDANLVFRSLREKGYADEISYASMMYLYKSLGVLHLAVDVAEEMMQSGPLTDCASYNMVMECYAHTGQLRRCGELLYEMISQKVVPDKGTFGVLFTVLKEGKMPIEAVRQLESSYSGRYPCAFEAVTTSVFCLVGLHAFAIEMCETLTKAKKPLGLFAYNAALYAYGSSAQIDKALNIFLKMQAEKIQPDVVTYIYLVDCYGKAGMFEGVKRIFNLLKDGAIAPSRSLFKALIDACKNANRRGLLKAVKKEMEMAFERKHDSESEAEDQCGENFRDVENLDKEMEFAFETEHFFPSLRLKSN